MARMSEPAGNRSGPTTAAPTAPAEPGAELSLSFDDNRLAGLVFRHYDQHVAHIERRLGIVLNALVGITIWRRAARRGGTEVGLFGRLA